MSKKLKVVLLGEGKVGKTALITRYCYGNIPEVRQQTLNASCSEKKLSVNNKELSMNIWDTAGQEIFNGIAPMYYRDADGAVLVYDITVKESFEKVNYWLGQIRMSAPKDIVILIVGNKIDRENERKISKEQVAHFCSENKLLHEEASAKDDMNVSQLFRNLAIEIVRVGAKQGGNSAGPGKKNLMDIDSGRLTSDAVKRGGKHGKKEGCCKGG